MSEGDERENCTRAADARPHRHLGTRRGYRLRKPNRFFGRIAQILFLGILILVMAGSLKKAAAQFPGSSAAVHVPSQVETDSQTPEPTPEPSVEPSPVLAAPPAGYVWTKLLVVLDAGHGGRDPGAVSPEGPEVLEKDIALAIAQFCRNRLEAGGIPVLMTRESDKALAQKVQADLDVRTAMANDADATLFVSIHVNSLDLSIAGARDVSGMECYYAKKENLYPAVSDETFAKRLGESMAANNGKKLNAVNEYRLAVLRSTKMPAALVEVGYITNESDLASLKSDAYRETTAQGIAEAILRTVADMSPVKENGIWHVLRAESFPAGASGK